MEIPPDPTLRELQQLVREEFKIFGRTPLAKRLRGIEREALEMHRTLDLRGQRDELGDLLCELLAYGNETDTDLVACVRATLEKIRRRHLQYATLGRRFDVGLYGGAFDPITIGHIETARLPLDAGVIDETWLMPAFQHMYNKPMRPAPVRVQRCRLAAKSDARIKVFEYEIDNQMRGETYHLVMRLLEDAAYEEYRFHLIIGLDNANNIHKWTNHEELERAIPFIVIPRAGEKVDPGNLWYTRPPHRFIAADAPTEISSTIVRQLLREGRDAEAARFLHPDVFADIIATNDYRD